jgi:heme-degrading monooxygenase HmoA
MPVANFTAIWEFHVKPEARSQFERIYGPDGDWAQLFRRSPEYCGTTLLQDRDHPERYLTLDHWASRDALAQFKREHHADYAALDKKCESLTEKETFVGDFDNLTSTDKS